ncbi:MAG TPA: BlaI/MecI/CopY family transcriptional regulator [Nitriliruptorales bacterium]
MSKRMSKRNEGGRREDPLGSLLGPLEQDVMEIAWRLGDATVRDVHDVLAQRREIAYTTVMTTMSRLATKGYLRRDATGLAHRYVPAVSKDAYGRSAVAQVMGWLVERYPEPAVAYLAHVVDGVDDVTIEQLRAAVDVQRSQER